MTLVLRQLWEAGLQINIKTCEFDVEETMFLDIIVSGKGLCMDSQKVQAIIDWLTPTNLKEIQGFVRFANFYHWFIHNFSKLVKPLVNLT